MPTTRARNACDSIGAIVPLPAATPPISTMWSGGSGGSVASFEVYSRTLSRRACGVE